MPYYLGKPGSESPKAPDVEGKRSRLLSDLVILIWLIILTLLLILCMALTMKRWWLDYCSKPKHHKYLDDSAKGILYKRKHNGREEVDM